MNLFLSFTLIRAAFSSAEADDDAMTRSVFDLDQWTEDDPDILVETPYGRFKKLEISDSPSPLIRVMHSPALASLSSHFSLEEIPQAFRPPRDANAQIDALWRAVQRLSIANEATQRQLAVLNSRHRWLQKSFAELTDRFIALAAEKENLPNLDSDI